MHREIRQSEGCLESESPRVLAFVTFMVGFLMIWDLLRYLPGGAIAWTGFDSSVIPKELWGIRPALIAAVVGGARALYGALDSLSQGRPGADMAIAVAALASILLREHLVAAEVVLVGLCGECLEWWTFERTKSQLRGLVEICPSRCWRILPDGTSERVETTSVRVGDKIGVKAGARVPVDGILIEGRGPLDTSVLTGESLPVELEPGDEVLAGYVNLQARLVIEARRVAEHTVAGRIAEWTASALGKKASIERLADQYARWFLPIVMVLAAGTFLVGLAWFGFTARDLDGTRLQWSEAFRRASYPALGVLVVTCPCALILATPAAVIAAMGRLAGTGILIKGGAALERLAQASAFAFDKTGTLTTGKLKFAGIRLWSPSGVGERDGEDVLLRLAASVEVGSDHPLAILVVEEAKRRGIEEMPLAGIREYAGLGVGVETPQGRLLAGSVRFLMEQGALTENNRVWAQQQLQSEAASGIGISLGGEFLGLILAQDQPRPTASGLILDLKTLGFSPLAMLTGDNELSAGNIATKVGIEEIHAGLLPLEKAQWIEKNRESGKKVAFLGDGVNDSVALATADASIAVGTDGSDLAAQVSDIVILGEPLGRIPFLIRLSRVTLSVIRQNILIYALGLNILGIVLTSWLWPWIVPTSWESQSPLAGVVYHQIASLAVLINSMRLLWFERLEQEKSKSKLSRFFGKLAGWFDLDQWLHEFEHHMPKIFFGGIVVGLLVWGFSGFRIVSSGELGLVRRFGALQNEKLKPGLHCRWPFPIEYVHVSRVDQTRSVELGFRRKSPQFFGGESAGRVGEWTSSHLQEGVVRYPEESLVVTGDGNLIEVFLTIRYHIGNPAEADLLGAGEPGLVRMRAETILRKILGSSRSDDLLGKSRFQLSQWLTKEIRNAWETVNAPVGEAEPFSLIIEDVAVHDLHPPREVVQAYHSVAKAMENGQKKVRDAETLVLRRLAEEKSKAYRVIKVAESQSQGQLDLARAKLEAFVKRAASRKGSESITDFRAFWDAIAGALVQREKVLMDTIREPGRSALWMLPAEFGRYAGQGQSGTPPSSLGPNN